MKFSEVLAVYGAALSTAVFIWNVARAVPRFKVDLMTATDEIDGVPVFGVSVSVRNPSPNTIHLAGISILYRASYPTVGELLKHIWRFRRIPRTLGWVHTSPLDYGVETGCPCAVSPGAAHNVLIPDAELSEILTRTGSKEICAVAQDQLARNRYTGTLEVPWIKTKT